MSRPSRSLGVALVTAVVAVSLLDSWASATHLDVAVDPMAATSVTRPCSGTASASPEDAHGSHKFDDVRLTLPAGCGGRVQVSVLEDGTRIGSFDGGVAVGGAVLLDDIASSGYRPEEIVVIATLDGWDLPTAWTFTPPVLLGPIHAGNEDTVTSDVVWTSITNNPVQGCFSVDVSTTSSTPVVWRVTLDLAQAPFNGQATGYRIAGPDSWRYETYAVTPSAGYLQIGGTAAAEAGRRTIVAGQTYEVSVCHDALPPGAQTPSAYSVETVHGTWTDTRACLVTTVTGNGTSEFYFGWAAVVDMQTAVSRLQAAGRAFDAYTYSGNKWQQTWVPAPTVGPYAFQVTSTSPANIRLDESYVFEACAVDW